MSLALLNPKFYHLIVVQEKQKELVKLKVRYEKKHEKYSKILDQLKWLNAFSSGLSVTSVISSVTTLSAFIGLPVSIPLGAISLAGASVSGTATELAKKYQRN